MLPRIALQSIARREKISIHNRIHEINIITNWKVARNCKCPEISHFGKDPGGRQRYDIVFVMPLAKNAAPGQVSTIEAQRLFRIQTIVPGSVVAQRIYGDKVEF